MNNDRNGPPDDDAIARLLKGAGGRDQPDAAIAAQVRTAAELAARAGVSAPTPSQLHSVRRRRRTAAAFSVWLAMPLLDREGPVVATPVQASARSSIGTVRADWAPWLGGCRRVRNRRYAPRGPARGIRAALRSRSGSTGRRASFFDERDVARVSREGAAYVDSGITRCVTSRFALRTSAGTVRHVGTQYEARVADANRLRVAIREGSVHRHTWQRCPASPASRSADETTLHPERLRRTTRRTGRGGAAFCHRGTDAGRVSTLGVRETGRDPRYASDDAEREAARTCRRGSIEGLSPDISIAAW